MAKLVEILARELKEWPHEVASIAQDHDSCAHPYNSSEIEFNHGEWGGKNAEVMVSSYNVRIGERAEDCATAIVTRAEWQAAVDALKAKDAVAWDGVGLPPVGTICENVFPGEIWLEVIIIAHDGDMAVFRLNNSERLNYFGDTEQHFRPIRTPEQIAADEREEEVNRMVATVPMLDKGSARKVCYALYDNNYRKQEPK